MYTVVNLHLWGLALGAALFDHGAILVFHHVVEQPHVNRRYRAACDGEDARAPTPSGTIGHGLLHKHFGGRLRRPLCRR